MDAHSWDARYDTTELVWTQAPNAFVADILGEAAPGRALDVAAGEGRHAVWLARRGWQVTAVDFSGVGLARARAWAEAEGVADRLHTEVADVATYVPSPESFDLALFAYLQVPEPQRRSAIVNAASGVAVGGQLVVVAHDSSNLEHGHGGPPDASLLYTAADVVTDVAGASGSWTIERADVSERVVEGAPRPALDAVVVARRVG